MCAGAQYYYRYMIPNWATVNIMFRSTVSQVELQSVLRFRVDSILVAMPEQLTCELSSHLSGTLRFQFYCTVFREFRLQYTQLYILYTHTQFLIIIPPSRSYIYTYTLCLSYPLVITHTYTHKFFLYLYSFEVRDTF